MKYLAVAALVILSYFCRISNGNPFPTPLTFLALDPEARSYGMGGVGVAILGGPQTSFYNPAAIGGIRRISFEGSRFDIGYPDFNLTNISAGYNLGESGIAAINYTKVSLGSSITTDEFGNITKKYSPYEEMFSGSYSIELSPNFYVGTSVKYMTSDLSSISPQSQAVDVLAFDFGILVKSIFPNISYVHYAKKDSNSFNPKQEGFSVGASVLNLGPDVKYKDSDPKDPLPRLLRMGIAWKPIATEMFQTTLAADYEKSLVGLKSSFFKEFFDSDLFISKYGLEVNFFYVWTFRLGYRQDSQEEDHYYTSGFGFGPQWINFNIASGRRGGEPRYSVIFNYPLDLR